MMDSHHIYWYFTILLSGILNVYLVFAMEEAQIEKPKELLRHQQHHRPLFIARRSTSIHDINQSVSKELLSNAERFTSEQQLVKGKLNGEVNYNGMETSIETPQIRHGRSRGHFSRSKKVEEIGVIPKLSLVTNNGVSYEHQVENENEKMFVNENNVNNANDNIAFEYFKSIGSNINSTMYLDMDFDDSTMANLTSNISSLQVNRQPPKFGHIVSNSSGAGQSSDSLRKLYKVKASSKTMFSSLVTEPSDNTTRYHDIYGVIVHTPNNERHVDNVVDKNALEDYGGYDGYDDRQMKNWTDDYHFDNNNNNDDDDDDDDDDNNNKDNFDENFFATDAIKKPDRQSVKVDIVTRFLRIIENQHLLGDNCTAGTDLNLGEGVVDQYAQERFRLEANFAVNRANMLTRLWKYAPEVMLSSEYLLHASVLSMVEFDEDIFAAGNCYDKMQYGDHWLYCPFAHRLQDENGILVKDLAIEYKYLSNSSEWFYIARKNAERVIDTNNQFSRGYHSYTANESTHSDRIEDEILTVRYEDGRWSKPYYDCGGGNIWMLTYTVPFFGYVNDTYYFKGTSGIDIDLRRVDIDQCPLPHGSTQLNIFAASDKCKHRTTECVAIPGLGFRRGSYRCVCKRGFYYPDTKSNGRYYNGTVIEEEYEKLMLDEVSQYAIDGIFECLPCAEGCEYCENGSPCIVSLNWLMRTAILILECCVIACLPVVILFTWKYGNIKVVKAASPVLLRVIVLGAFFIYCTTIVMYPRPNVITCTIRVWLREIGFSLTYGALMLKTWRISVIFRVKSAKAVKITDMNLLKRLGIIVTIFSVFLGIRTIVAPPVVIVGRTADDLKAYLCRTDWWDHSFTTLEVMFLVWGIRLCIVVRKAPSEFNESRFISVAIYNEFLLSVFLNVSMLFLQSPANPDLLYIIFFCHTQLTVTILLGLIFGSKAYVVFRGEGKEDAMGKLPGASGKFIGKSCRAHGASNQTNSISLQQANFTEDGDGVTEEFRRFYSQLELLKEKNLRMGNRHLAAKILAMQMAANQSDTQVLAVREISPNLRFNKHESVTIEESAIVNVESGKLNVNTYVEVFEDSSNKMVTSVQLSIENGNEKHSESVNTMEKINGENGNKKISSMPLDQNTTTVSNKKVSTIESDNVNLETVISSTSMPSSSNIVDNPSEHNDTSNAEAKIKEIKEGEVHKSGHAHTHAIVINLDDKSRFSEEVTV